MKIKRIINEFRLIKALLLVGLFLLMSGKGWGQTAIVSNSGPICAGADVTLFVTGGDAVSWVWSTNGSATFSSSTEQNPIASGAVNGESFTVVITDINSNTANATTIVMVNALPMAPIITSGGPTTICSGGSVTLNSSIGTTYLWSTGETTESIEVSTSGSYTVQVTDVNGCQSAASAATLVTVNSLPIATINGTLTACVTTTLTAVTDAVTSAYVWYKDNILISGQTTSTLVVTASGAYKVKVTNENGCEQNSDAFTVTINPLPTTSAIYHQ